MSDSDIVGYLFEDSNEVDCVDCIKHSANLLGATLEDIVGQQYTPVYRANIGPGGIRCSLCNKLLTRGRTI